MNFTYSEPSGLKSWLYISYFSIVSYYKSNKPTPSNLLQISSQEEREKINTSLTNLWQQELSMPSPSFSKILIRHFLKSYLLIVGLQSLSTSMLIVESILVYYLTLCLEDDNATTLDYSLLTSGLILNSILGLLFFVNSNRSSYLLGVEVKEAVTNMISEKVLKLHCSVISKDNNRGRYLNTISADITAFDSTHTIVFFSSGTIGILGAFVAVQFYFGVWGVLGVGLSLIQIPIIIYSLRFTQDYRIEKTKVSDKRVKLIENMIEGIRIIKLYAWEIPYLGLIFQVKKKESEFDQKIIDTMSIFTVLWTAGVGMLIFISLTSYVGVGNELKVAEVFFLISMLVFAQSYYIQIAILGIRSYYLIQNSCKRIGEVLFLKEFTRIENEGTESAISLINSSFSWDGKYPDENNEESQSLNTPRSLLLTSLTFESKQNELLIIVGPSGSGKTTLLMGLLGELSHKSDKRVVSGTIGYSAEDPWIIPDTFKENILMGRAYNPDLYLKVLNNCALDRDIESLPNRDDSPIGDRGITLSGGQKARLGLARALYSSSDIYLLDDPLSAVDTEVGRHLFASIKELSRKKIVVLVTHQTHYVSQADKVLVLDRGGQVFFGTPEELNKYSAVIENIVLSSHRKKKSLYEIDLEKMNKPMMISDKAIDQSDITFKTYWKYTILGKSSVTLIVLVLILMIIGQIISYSTQYWCMLWLQSGDSYSNYYISGLGILVLVTFFLFTFRVYSFNHLLLNSNERLHNNALEGLVRTQAKYFDANHTGSLIVRFCKDASYLDEAIIRWYYELIAMALLVIITAIIQIIIMPYTAIIVPIWILLCYYMFHIYIPVVSQMKNVDLVVKAPLLSTYNSMLCGFATIRSLFANSYFLKIASERALICYRASYVYEIGNSTVQFYLLMSISIIVGANTIAIVATKDSLSVTFAAFTLVLSTVYIKLTRSFSKALMEMQSYMSSIQRLLYFSELEPEGAFKINQDFKITKGAIVFANIFMRYDTECKLALNNLSFSIGGGTKVGIIGRTGAGKSSILQVLFRLVNPESGIVFIDGVDHMLLDLYDLRKQLAVIPQSSFLFNASIRDNLDPFKEHTDQEILNLLEEVSLNVFAEDATFLDSLIVGKDINFSGGQKQLLCLVRAVLRNNKIVMMDEATSNIDNDTDKIIQDIVRKKFKDCTVLIIAHRLRTIINSDQIIVMEDGACVQSGKPSDLFKEENSLLKKLILHTGSEESDLLISMLNKNN